MNSDMVVTAGSMHTGPMSMQHEVMSGITTATKASTSVIKKKSLKKERAKPVEVPLYEFMDVEVEKVVEVPTPVEKVIIHEIPKPQYVEKVYKVKNEVKILENIRRRVPCPLEHVTQYVFTLPMIRPTFDEITVPLHIPRFIDIPVPADTLPPGVASRCELLAERVQYLYEGGVSLCEIENIAAAIGATNFDEVSKLESLRQDVAVMRAWDTGSLKLKPGQTELKMDYGEALKKIPNHYKKNRREEMATY